VVKSIIPFRLVLKKTVYSRTVYGKGNKAVQYYLFFGLLFAFLVAIFAVQNANPVDIVFLAWQVKGVSLSLVLLGGVVAGAAIALVLGLPRQFRMTLRIRELTAKLAEYEMRPKTGDAADSGEQAGNVLVTGGRDGDKQTDPLKGGEQDAPVKDRA